MITTYSPLQRGLGDWIEDSVESSFDKADIVLIPGGADVNPALYGHTKLPSTHIDQYADTLEMALIDRAVEANKFVLGICKGSQMVTARAGGWLIQHVTGHGGNHDIRTHDGNTFKVTSTHHQMCFPYDLPEEDYQLLGWAEELSSRYQAAAEIDIEEATHPSNHDGGYFKEPEVIWYPKIRALACQSHPEHGRSPSFNEWLNEEVKLLLAK